MKLWKYAATLATVLALAVPAWAQGGTLLLPAGMA